MPVNPADSEVFGTLYGSDAMRRLFDDHAWLQRMLEVEAALARVEAGLGIIPADAARAITDAARLGNLDLAALAATTRNVGYPVVGLVKELNRAAGVAGRWTHWGATTQDIMDTALVLQIRDGIELMTAALVAIAGALARQAEAHRCTLMSGRTHLQHALPITFGLKCALWLQPMLAHLDRLRELRPRVLIVQFGGAAGTLASLGDQGIAVMEGLAAELGLAAPPTPWHVLRDGLAETVGFLGLIAGSFAKIATDVILLAQTEIAEAAEPYVEGRGSSSTMPQKRNPIASEYILAAARVVQALVPVMQGAIAADHERATGPWQAEALALPQSFVLTHGAALHTLTLAQGLTVDAARMRRNLDADGGLSLAEAVMMGLAPHLGRSEAHHIVQRAVAIARASQISLAAALAGDSAVTSRLNPETIGRLTDPEAYLGATSLFVTRVLAKAQEILDRAGASPPIAG
ncbi:MAG: class-II fumarase/aspartase family protein [Acetobacteraceae bacterium]